MKTTLALIAALGLAVPTAAETIPYNIEVSFADLNLDSAEGQARLDRRLEHAARKVCGYDRVVTGNRILSSEVNACVAKTKARAHDRVALARDGQALGG